MALILALCAILLWAVSLVLEKRSLAHMDAIAFGFIRPLVASIILVPYVVLTAGFTFPSYSLLLIAVMGGIIDMFLGIALFMYAIKRVSAHEVGPLSNTAPLWGVIAAAIWLRESPAWTAYIAAILVVIGSYLLAARVRNLKRTRDVTRALMAALGAGLCWGIADTVMAKYCLTHGMHRATLQITYVAAAAICWGIASFVRGRFRRSCYPWKGLRLALLTSVIGMVGGMLIWVIALDLAPASILSPIRGALSIFVLVLSVIFLRERPTQRAAVGVGFVALGVALTSIYG